jgi:two-component system chemotaxis response regulator CheB
MPRIWGPLGLHLSGLQRFADGRRRHQLSLPVGHAWTPEALFLARDRETESALRVALRSLEEKAKLSRKHAAVVGPGALQRRYAEIAQEAERAVAILRDRLTEVVSE